MCTAVAEYTKAIAPPSLVGRPRQPAILVVISEDERNVFDQRSIEAACFRENPFVPILRRTFGQLSEATGRLNVGVKHHLLV